MPFWSWFSQSQATNALKNANTQTLRNALKNYLKAVNSLSNKSNVSIKYTINKYRNRIGNGVANAVIALRRAAGAVNNPAVSETTTAQIVNKAANALTNVQNIIVNGGNSVKIGKNKNGMWQFSPNTSNNIRRNWRVNANGSVVRINALTNVQNVIVNGGNSVKIGKNKNGMWQFSPNTSNNIRRNWRVNANGSVVRKNANSKLNRNATKKTNYNYLSNLMNKNVNNNSKAQSIINYNPGIFAGNQKLYDEYINEAQKNNRQNIIKIMSLARNKYAANPVNVATPATNMKGVRGHIGKNLRKLFNSQY
jgi:hypothetical protein